MKLDLDNMQSPCVQCYMRSVEYSPDSASCQRCEYNIAIQILKTVLKTNNYCTLCKNVINIGGGYYKCKLEDNDFYHSCEVEKDFAIDWKAVCKEYGIEVSV